MQTGHLGEFFTALAMASAAVSSISFFVAEKSDTIEKNKWEKLAKGGWWAHILGVLGVIITLFYLIYSHDYRYHYVWEHSSNELPIHFMISCYWEGQEGSFLLWIFWHSVLGSILIIRAGEWRNLVLSVIASVQMILCTMILGTYYPELGVKSFYILAMCLPALVFAYPFLRSRSSELRSDIPATELQTTGTQTFALASILLTLCGIVLTLRNQAGFSTFWSWKQAFSSLSGGIFALFVCAILAYTLYYLYLLLERKLQVVEVFAGAAVLAFGVLGMYFEASAWKIGSTPFMMLKDAMANAPIFKAQPDFTPTNGTGLNPLLQNYWMVIHPPTLFLGFASTIVPFAYVIAALIKGKYTEWINPARPWLLFSVMILGIGIIMGGYWAYETLNFGGYWNWDPVENASFVPWLTGIASLHTLLIFQKAKTHLRLSMILVVTTFMLVLYSTFLTRSGILGETSVHTFTDLGLSGQLLLLVFVYLIPVTLTFYLRWKQIPTKEDTSSLWTAEFLLFLGSLVFIFSAAEICFSTSLPVFNKIFGTHIAPPAKIQLFYYKWNVYFAIAFGVLSGIAQFTWWWKAGNKKLSDAIFRPFAFAAVLTSAVIIALAYYQRDFAFHTEFAKLIEKGGIIGYIEWAILGNAEKVLFLSSLFAIAANLDILIGHLKKNTKGLKFIGGTLTHIGFALMLIGMLFSSGYDRVISKNLTPADLEGFKGDEQNDNVLLPAATNRQMLGWNARYLGKKQAEKPLSNFQLIEETAETFKIKFNDKEGETFAMEMPRNVFQMNSEQSKANQAKEKTSKGALPANNNGAHGEKGGDMPDAAHQKSAVVGNAINMQFVQDFIDKNLEYLKPQLINNRTKFKIALNPLADSTKAFVLSPESEVNQEMNSILSHPSRKIFWDKDVYVHVSSIPNPKDVQVEPKYYGLDMQIGQTDTVGQNLVTLMSLVNLTEQALQSQPDIELAVGANVKISPISKPDSIYEAHPVYVIDKSRKVSMVESNVPSLGLKFAFVKIDTENKRLTLQVEAQPIENDWIVIKAIEKPFINFLWLGTFILTAGFLVAIYRRRSERKIL